MLTKSGDKILQSLYNKIETGLWDNCTTEDTNPVLIALIRKKSYSLNMFNTC